MSIVAISETAGSLGNEIGRRLAERLGYRFADREIISKAAEQFGQDVQELRHGLEERPSLWERLTATQDRYRTYVEAVILETAIGDNAVLAGLASTIVLRPVSHALRVRTHGSERIRADRVEQQQGLTREAALDYVRRTDHERAARVKFLYHLNVDDPMLYDLGLNTDRMTADEGARLVQAALQEPRFQPTDASRRELTDLAIVAAGKAAFMANPLIDAHRAFLSSSGGAVSLSGTVDSEDARTAAQEAVRRLPGVKGVVNEIIVLPSVRRPLARY
jgi:cytidylate kinase